MCHYVLYCLGCGVQVTGHNDGCGVQVTGHNNGCGVQITGHNNGEIAIWDIESSAKLQAARAVTWGCTGQLSLLMQQPSGPRFC